MLSTPGWQLLQIAQLHRALPVHQEVQPEVPHLRRVQCHEGQDWWLYGSCSRHPPCADFHLLSVKSTPEQHSLCQRVMVSCPEWTGL